MSKTKKTAAPKVDAAKVKSVEVVEENQIPAGADVKDEGIELAGDPKEVERVEKEAEKAAAEAEAPKDPEEEKPENYKSILARINAALGK